ncbi:hypothetical protein [Microbacterium schleiferi]|uniref:hypothetical protein n=1 Tax=Microbacterium schleiferi TaxID=69362 RepID=UPI0035C85054
MPSGCRGVGEGGQQDRRDAVEVESAGADFFGGAVEDGTGSLNSAAIVSAASGSPHRARAPVGTRGGAD